MSTRALTQSLKLNSILVATDFSPASELPLLHAIALAHRYGASLHVVHIVSSLGFTLAGPGALALATEAAWRDIGELEKQLSRKRVLQGLDTHFIVAEGLVIEEVEDFVLRMHIDLAIVGTHRRKGIERLLLGSVAEQIFRYASCPVMTIGPHSVISYEAETPHSDRSLLFATDFGAPSLKTLPRALSLASQLGKRLILLHVLGSVSEEGNCPYASDDVAQLRERARRTTVERLARLVSQQPGFEEPPAFVVSFEEPVAGVLQTAEALHSDMIILGLAPRTYVATISHLPWSTAYGVVCGASCPVLSMKY